MTDDGQADWLPPKAPGADPPQQWESLPEPRAPIPTPAPAAPPSAAPATAEWWQGSGAAAQGPGYTHPITARPPAVAAPGNAHAVAALTLGIAGLVLFPLSGFGLVFILNLPCSILAWVFGVQGVRRVDRGETSARRGMAQTGLVLGIIGTVIGILAIAAWALGFIFSEDLRDEFQREWERQQNRNR